MKRIWAIVAAAGSGERLGTRVPKGFVRLGDTTILEQSLIHLIAEGITNIVVALPTNTDFHPEKLPPDSCRLAFVPGGVRRQDSVMNAAMHIPDDAGVVFIHDAARPFIRKGLVAELFDAALKHGVAVPAIPCADTIKRVSKGFIAGTVSRADLFAVQTPQAFRMDIFNSMIPLYEKHDVTDDCALAEMLGVSPYVVKGSSRTFKITTPDDLELAEGLIREEN